MGRQLSAGREDERRRQVVDVPAGGLDLARGSELVEDAPLGKRRQQCDGASAIG